MIFASLNRLLCYSKNRHILKFIILFSFLLILFLNFHLLDEINNSSTQQEQQEQNEHLIVNLDDSSQKKILVKPTGNRKISLNNDRKRNDETATSTLSEREMETRKKLLELRATIGELNRNQSIRNSHFILDLLEKESTTKQQQKNKTTTEFYYETPKFLVILVQVHSRIKYLESLIDSLRQTRDIEQTLVIFSHDIYDPEMNGLIEKIKFCSTLQIFYPYSLQLYPNEFPGKDRNDCDTKMTKAE